MSQKGTFKIASEASYAYFFGQKFIKNAKICPKPEFFGQTVLPDLAENAKNEKFKCDILRPLVIPRIFYCCQWPNQKWL